MEQLQASCLHDMQQYQGQALAAVTKLHFDRVINELLLGKHRMGRCGTLAGRDCQTASHI